MSNIARNKPIKKVLIFAAVVEAVTGLTMLIAPSLVGQLLLGDKLAGAAILVARVTGIALIGLGGGLLARPASSRHVCVQRSRHFVSFYVGFVVGLTGVLLWPAVALHLLLSIFLGRVWFTSATR